MPRLSSACSRRISRRVACFSVTCSTVSGRVSRSGGGMRAAPMMLRLSGRFPVIPTPLRSGVIDRESIERLVAWVGPHVDGLTVLGSSGESGYLSLSQKREALAAFVEAAHRQSLPLIVGVTDPATEGAIALV